MGIGGTNNPQYQDTSWLQNFLTQHEGQTINVQTGPGGITISVGGESVFVGPSQMGVLSTFKGHDVVIAGSVNPNQPFLLLPETTTFTLNQSWVSWFINYLGNPSETTGSGDATAGTGFGFLTGLNFGTTTSGKPVDTALNLPLPADISSSDPQKVYNALLQWSGLENDAGISDTQKLAYESALQGIANQIAANNANGTGNEPLQSGDVNEITNYLASLIPSNSGLSSDDITFLSGYLSDAATTLASNEYISGLSSSDPDQVYQSLLQFTGFDTDTSLTPDEKAAFETQLHQLATKIATQNATGQPDPALLSNDPKQLGTYIMSQMNLSSLSTDDQVLFENYMGEACNEISSLNAVSGKPTPQPQAMQNMQSTDSKVVYNEIVNELLAQGLTQDQINQLSPQLQALAANIAAQNGQPGGYKLDICDPATLTAELVSLLGSSNDPTNAALQAALSALGVSFSGVNSAYYYNETLSTDPNIVLDGLKHLSNITNNPNLTPDEVSAATDYLKLMAMALAFMSKVRARISIMEAELRKEQSEGKQANIVDQTKAALHSFTTGIQSVNYNLEKILKALAQAKLMSWLMPLLMALFAVIMIAIMIASAGTLGPVLLAVMIAVTIAMTAIMIANQTTNCLGNLADKLGIHSKAGKEAFSMGLQIAIMAMVTAVTLGAAAPVMMANMSMMELGAAAGQIGAQMGSRAALIIGIGMVASTVMSSGLLTDGLVALFRKMGMSQQDAAIAAMVTTIVIMLLMFFAMAKAMPAPSTGTYGTSGAGAKLTADVPDDLNIGGLFQETGSGKGPAVGPDVSGTSPVGGEGGGEGEGSTAGTTGVPAGTTDVADSALSTGQLIDKLRRLLDKIVELAQDAARVAGAGGSWLGKQATNPNFYLQMVQCLGMLANCAADVEQAVFDFGQSKIAEAQAALARLNGDAQALLSELQQLTNSFDATDQDLNADAQSFIKFVSGLCTMFASWVASASQIVSNATAPS